MDKEVQFYPLTHAQKGIWYIEKLYPNTDIGNLAFEVKFNIEIDKVIIERAVNTVVYKNDGLRLRISENVCDVRQFISEFKEIKIDIFEFKNSDDVDLWLACQTCKPFNLLNSDLFYFALLKMESNETILFIKIHHIISDIWTFSLVINQIKDIYTDLAEGKAVKQEKMPSYIKYIKSEQKYENNGEFDKNKAFWIEKYSTIPPKSILKPVCINKYNILMKRKVLYIPKELTSSIFEFCKNENTSVFKMFLAAIYIFMSRITSQEDIVVGTPLYNRFDSEYRDIAGMFASIIPFRMMYDSKLTFRDILKLLKDELRLIIENRKYPYDLLLEELREKNKNIDDLYDFVFSYQNSVFNKDVKVDWIPCSSSNNSIAMHVSNRDSGEQLKIEIDYKADLYTEEEIVQICKMIQNILKYSIEQSTEKIKDIEILSKQEKERILYSFNNTRQEYACNVDLQEIFEQQVEKTPDNIAVVYEGTKLTYKDLNNRANQLAILLRKMGVRASSIVVLLASQSVEVIIGILGVLKAGGAYLPIDTKFPTDRVKYILEDSNADIVLMQRNLLGMYAHNKKVLVIDDEDLYKGDCSNPAPINTPSDLAYVIYTSGSTGRPKGVMIERKSIVNLVMGLEKNIYSLYGAHLNVALIAPFIFDASVQQIFASLLLGHCLFIVPDNVKVDVGSLMAYYKHNKINISDGTPTLLKILTDGIESFDKNLKIDHLIIGGETLDYKVLVDFFNRFRGQRPSISNVYGPTECSVDATCHLINPNELNEITSVPIGKPMTNVKVYVLNNNMGILPIGYEGEIYISGEGVGRGYINNPDMTNERFIENPIIQGEKLYRTGDLGKWMEDGKLYCIGRIDSQVKIKGYRIELKEIELQLLRHEAVKQAVVATKVDEEGGRFICAYIVTKQYMEVLELREHLLKNLPEYMIPVHFIQIEQIPLLQNGKINMETLNDIKVNTCNKDEYAAPQNSVEADLTHCWQEILKIDKVGVNSNYFVLGGDSIKAIQIASLMQRYQLKIKTSDIMKYPTIRQVSPHVELLKRKVEQEALTGTVELLPIQKWFFKHEYNEKKYYNQSVILYSRKGFLQDDASKVIEKIIKHHDALRLVFITDENKSIMQFNKDSDGTFEMKVVNIPNTGEWAEIIDREVDAIEKSINLKSGPLLKAGMFKTVNGDYLLITVHHLVIDAVSWRILVEDFINGYKQCGKNCEIIFNDKTDSFRRWSEIVYKYSQSKELLSEITYWEKLTRHEAESILKPFTPSEKKNNYFETIRFELCKEKTDYLLRDTNKAYDTNITDILLAALAMSIKKSSGVKKVTIMLEGHGREEIIDDIDLTRTLGWFTTMYPIVMEFPEDGEITSYIMYMREYLRHVPNKGIGYGILRYISALKKEDIECLDIRPEILFNYLGEFEEPAYDGIELFKPVYLAKGNFISEYPIDILGMVVNDQLIVNFTFNTKVCVRDFIKDLMDYYKKYLIEIIDFCLSIKETQFNPSDLTYKELSIQELEEISKMIRS